MMVNEKSPEAVSLGNLQKPLTDQLAFSLADRH
jgi:hypothetical protein